MNLTLYLSRVRSSEVLGRATWVCPLSKATNSHFRRATVRTPKNEEMRDCRRWETNEQSSVDIKGTEWGGIGRRHARHPDRSEWLECPIENRRTYKAAFKYSADNKQTRTPKRVTDAASEDASYYDGKKRKGSDERGQHAIRQRAV